MSKTKNENYSTTIKLQGEIFLDDDELDNVDYYIRDESRVDTGQVVNENLSEILRNLINSKVHIKMKNITIKSGVIELKGIVKYQKDVDYRQLNNKNKISKFYIVDNMNDFNLDDILWTLASDRQEISIEINVKDTSCGIDEVAIK